MNILFITEDSSFRLLVRKYLVEEKHNVFLGKDVKDGMQVIKTEKIDLVISDLNMKFMDGFDLCKQVRQVLGGKEIPFILVTIYEDEVTKLKIEALKNSALIRKGGSPGEIVKLINSLTAQEENGENLSVLSATPENNRTIPSNVLSHNNATIPNNHLDAQILLVDDDDNLRLLLGETLKDEGYKNISEAFDGAEAIALLQNQHFNLILLDIIMPNVSGFGVLKFVHENTPDVKVIMLTAYADMKLAVEAKKLGAADFIAKPFMRDDLLNTIKQVLSQ